MHLQTSLAFAVISISAVNAAPIPQSHAIEKDEKLGFSLKTLKDEKIHYINATLELHQGSFVEFEESVGGVLPDKGF
jgi:hypothetical protein